MTDKKNKKRNITEEQLLEWLADLMWDTYLKDKKNNSKNLNNKKPKLTNKFNN